MDNTRFPKHAVNYKPRGRRDRGRPRKRWQRVDAGIGQSTYSMEEDYDDDDNDRQFILTKCYTFQRSISIQSFFATRSRRPRGGERGFRSALPIRSDGLGKRSKSQRNARSMLDDTSIY
jgi:hypothetical protein